MEQIERLMTKEEEKIFWNSMQRSFCHKFKINRVEEGENCLVVTSTQVVHFVTKSMMMLRSGQPTSYFRKYIALPLS
jgi:KaiC/GvpD/RAD55 family RecA-like ATPase